MLPVTKSSLLKGTIKKYMEIRHVSPVSLALAGMMSERTFYKRMNNPGSFKLDEIQRILTG